MAENLFHIILQNFNEGNAPLAQMDDKTFIGNAGQASDSKADLLSKPGFITQSPGLLPLTNATQAGNLNELIRFILDVPTDTDTTYGVGTSHFFKISSTSLINTGGYPKSVSGMTEGESAIVMNGNLYIFYNKASGGDIAAMPLDTEVLNATWGTVTVSGGLALIKAPHPSATKEDIILFGNGQYVGVYIQGNGTIDTRKLDFKAGATVVDIVYNANSWYIAVNYGSGSRVRGEVFIYDGSATSAVLSDEAGVGLQKIGFLYVLNGQVYICYQDSTTNAYTVGFINGRQLKPLAYFSGSLPDHKQKTLYKHTILFISNNEVWTAGSVVQQLPIQSSKLSSGGYATVGAIAAPFGTPMIASSDGAGNYKLVKFSGYSTDSYWKGIYMDTTQHRDLAQISDVIVKTKPLVGNARADITIEGNQSSVTSNILQVSGAGKIRHVFRSISLNHVADVRVVVSYANGDTTNDCPIREIEIGGTSVKE